MRRVLSVLLILSVTPTISLAQQVPAGVDTVGVTPVNLVGLGPNGATLRCRDGSYPAPFAADAACTGKGGVLVRFRVRGTPPPPGVRTKTPPAASVMEAPPAASPAVRTNAVLPPPDTKPEGATLLCRDGSYVLADTSATRCAARGGVKVRFLRPPS